MAPQRSHQSTTTSRRRTAASAALLCCWLACLASPAAAQASPPAGGRQQQPNATAAAASALPAPEPQPTQQQQPLRFPLIVIFKDARALAKLRVMCNPSVMLYRTFHLGLGLARECHMPDQCKRIYTTAVTGMSGDFTNSELARLERCLPESIFYKELDGEVHKAEDDGYWQRPEAEAWEGEPEAGERPTAQQTQQAPAKPARPAGSRGAVGGAGPLRSGGRRMRQLGTPLPGNGRNQPPQGFGQQVPPGEEPRVTAFEERVKTPVDQDTAINLYDLTQGKNMNLPGEKQQVVGSRLWNLDRLDQRELPLDGVYSYGTSTSNGTGQGVTIYVVDSGIRLNHQEFKNDLGTRVRASYGRDFVEDDDVSEDCDGHGTHVSATAVGLQVGVAKEADVVAVRILDCTGSGTISDTVAGLDWVAANHKKPAVVTLSLGIQVGSWSRVLEDAVRNLALQHNVTVVVASGNSGVDACYVAPANVPEVITVAASNLATKYNGTRSGDAEDSYKWANTGPCIDVFAPGVDIYSACGGQSRCQVVDDRSYTYASGTSMAVPHVAGVAAVYLSANPGATPQQVASLITSTATPNNVVSARFKPGTPNRLLYSRLDQQPEVQAANGPRP